MLNDWDFAQFFTNWNSTTTTSPPVGVAATTRSSEEPMEEKSSSSSGSSSGRGGLSTPPPLAGSRMMMHRRNESDSALANVIKVQSNVSDPLFVTSRMPWAPGNRHRSVREPTLTNDESVSLTEFSRKASQLELRSKTGSGGGGGVTSEFAPPRREKTDILDLRRLELKKELEERRRGVETGRHSQSEVVRGSSAVISSSSNRPPLLKSTSEPCAPLALFRDHQQVRAGHLSQSTTASNHKTKFSSFFF